MYRKTGKLEVKFTEQREVKTDLCEETTLCKSWERKDPDAGLSGELRLSPLPNAYKLNDHREPQFPPDLTPGGCGDQ